MIMASTRWIYELDLQLNSDQSGNMLYDAVNTYYPDGSDGRVGPLSGDSSYEDNLLNLLVEELTARVGSRLSEEDIMGHLETRTHVSTINASGNQEPEICVICQAEYENAETIGILKCEHGYHADCIKKWLRERNTCPLCNSSAV